MDAGAGPVECLALVIFPICQSQQQLGAVDCLALISARSFSGCRSRQQLAAAGCLALVVFRLVR